MNELHLTAVCLVLRNQRDFNDLDGVVGAVISDFLVEDMPLDRACKLSSNGSVFLLDLVWSRALRSADSRVWSVAKLLHTEPHYHRWAFAHAMAEAVRQGEMPLIQWLLDHFPDCPIYREVLAAAAEWDRREVLNLLKDQGRGEMPCADVMRRFAAVNGHWDFVHWPHKDYTAPVGSCPRCLFIFAYRQQCDILHITGLSYGAPAEVVSLPTYTKETWPAFKKKVRFLREEMADGFDLLAPTLRRIDDVSGRALIHAAVVGDLEFLQWAAHQPQRRPEIAFGCALRGASLQGRIPEVEYLLSHMERAHAFNGSPESEAMFAASEGGKLLLVQWLYEQYGLDPSMNFFRAQSEIRPWVGSIRHAMDIAAKHGHLPVLQYLDHVGGQLREKRDMQSGDLQASRIHRPRCTTLAMDSAAEAGHLDVVKWLHENRREGCTTAAMDRAANYGHLDVVQWLNSNRSEGCTSAAWNTGAPAGSGEVSESTGRFDVIRGTTGNVMDAAARARRLDVVQWLDENRSEGCTSAAMDSAAAYGHLAMVKWLGETCCEGCPSTAMTAAAGYGGGIATHRQREVVKYFLDSGKEVSVTSAMAKAVKARHFEIVLLLHARRITFSDDEIREMKDGIGVLADSVEGAHELRNWLEENYPSATD
jgi:hypothetical protein